MVLVCRARPSPRPLPQAAKRWCDAGVMGACGRGRRCVYGRSCPRVRSIRVVAFSSEPGVGGRIYGVLLRGVAGWWAHFFDFAGVLAAFEVHQEEDVFHFLFA